MRKALSVASPETGPRRLGPWTTELQRKIPRTKPIVLGADVLRLEPLKAVKARIGLSEATIYRLLAAGQFPKAHRRVGKKSLWLSTDIDTWILDVPAKSAPEL